MKSGYDLDYVTLEVPVLVEVDIQKALHNPGIAPTPYHSWRRGFVRRGKPIPGRWRAKWGKKMEAEEFLAQPEQVHRYIEGQKTIIAIKAGTPTDESPIRQVLNGLGVDRSEGRRWRSQGGHPQLRWDEKFRGTAPGAELELAN